ncbi:MAG: amino acid permease [Candidatus Bathyarchaeota archaeon]|jgi:APA family basic amino acid/polyamine antiporter|nr:amino acid permease [Candidatus Bathyarchaeota archaeon A05DMB-3]MDH7606517.1 amino acid permease [Candidatus Bathyarchaeota archaeon]
MNKEKAQQSARLKPTLGLFDATAISVGAIVGAGIYVVTGIAAGYAGPALTISMLIAAVVAVFTALSFSELTAWQPREGSIYEYAYQLISPFAGFLTGWMWIISNIFAGAAVALGFANYFHALFPVFPPNLVAAMLCLSFTVLNFFGIRQSALLNNILVAAKMLILVFFVVYGLLFVNSANFASFNPFQTGVFSAAFYIFFAYGGFARVAVVAEEVKDARKNVPRAIVLSLAISTIVYVFVGLVAVGLVGAAKLALSNSPLTEAINVTGNAFAAYLVSAGGLVATASVLLTAILGVSRMAYAMARRRDLPQILSKLHSRFNTPSYSIWMVGLAMILLVLFVDITRVVAISTFALLFYYALANVSALRLKNHNRVYPKIVSIVGAATCIGFLAFTLVAKTDAWIIGVTALAVSAVYYWFRKKLTERVQDF